MGKTIVAGDDRRKRAVIRTWVTNQAMFTGNVFIDGNYLYRVTTDHTSSDITSDLASSKLARLDKRVVAAGIRDIGPYIAYAGHYAASSRDTGYRESDHGSNEIVVGYAPRAINSDNGGWSDGGRVTVRFGFILRLQKLNTVD